MHVDIDSIENVIAESIGQPEGKICGRRRKRIRADTYVLTLEKTDNTTDPSNDGQILINC
jgi:hypothetical protein